MILGDFGYEGLEEALVCEGKGDNEKAVQCFNGRQEWEGRRERKSQGEYIHNMSHTGIRGSTFKLKGQEKTLHADWNMSTESQNLTKGTIKERISFSNRESICL